MGSYMIRPAEEEDFASVLELARLFWSVAGYKEPFDDDHAMKMMKLSHESGLLVVLELGGWVVGFVSAVMIPLLVTAEAKQATELAYYVKKEHRGCGIDLLKHLEKRARELGASYINMISLQASNPEVAEHIYAKLGYSHIESTFRKEL